MAEGVILIDEQVEVKAPNIEAARVLARKALEELEPGGRSVEVSDVWKK